jgi:hypothetical protein
MERRGLGGEEEESVNGNEECTLRGGVPNRRRKGNDGLDSKKDGLDWILMRWTSFGALPRGGSYLFLLS